MGLGYFDPEGALCIAHAGIHIPHVTPLRSIPIIDTCRTWFRTHLLSDPCLSNSGLARCVRSLTRAQNEDVVASVTESLKGVVQVVPCALAGNDSWPCSPGSLEHTLKFDPVTSHTSGLFIACIEKLHSS